MESFIQYHSLNESVQTFDNGSEALKTYMTHHDLKSRWGSSTEAQNHVKQTWGGKGGHVIKVKEGDRKLYFVAVPKDQSKVHEHSPFHKHLSDAGYEHKESKTEGMGNLNMTQHRYEHPNGKKIDTSFLEGSGFHWTTPEGYHGPHGYNEKTLKAHLDKEK